MRLRQLGIAVVVLAFFAGAAGADRLFVSNEADGTVSVIDTEEKRVIATVAVGKRPRGVGLSPDGGALYVALGNEDAIGVVDTKTLKLVRKIPSGSDPEAFAVHPNGTLYVSNEDEGKLSAIDPHSGKLLAELSVGIEPEGVAVSPDGSRVLVTAESTSTVHLIRVPEHEEAATALVGARPRAGVFSHDGRSAFVTSEIGREIARLDVAAGRVVESVRIDLPNAKPMGIVLAPNGSMLYVSMGRGNAVAVLGVDPLEVRSTIAVGKRPWGLALSSDGRWLYTANGLDDSVSVIDTKRGETVFTISVGRRPWGVVVGR